MVASRPLSAAAALAVIAAAVLVAVYWRAFWHLAAGLVALRLAWVILRARLGIRKTRRGKSAWEVLAALLGGFLLGKHRPGHECAGCGAPIPAPSRAAYCSPACRQYARLARAEIQRRADRIAAMGDIPF